MLVQAFYLQRISFYKLRGIISEIKWSDALLFRKSEGMEELQIWNQISQGHGSSIM